METTMTLSHLADLIIVISFFSICGAGLGYMVAELRHWRHQKETDRAQGAQSQGAGGFQL